MTYNQRDIIIVPFPFTDLSSIKQRPALIISSDAFNKNEDVVVVAITSQVKTDLKFRVDISNAGLESGILPKTSQARCDKIYTLNNSIVRKKIAKLNETIFRQIIACIENIYK